MSSPLIWRGNTAKILPSGGLIDYLGNPILPAQAGNAGKVLGTNGTTASWGSPVHASGTYSTMTGTTGTDGQFFWDTSHKAIWGWNTDRWDLIWVDPRNGFILFDEFIGSDRIGMLDWNASGITITAGNLLNSGIYTCSQSAASGVNFMYSQVNNIQLGTGDFFYEALVNIPTLSDGTNNAVFSVGFSDGTSFDSAGKATDGCYFTLDRNIDTTHWNTNTVNNGSITTKTGATSASVPAAGTFYRMRIEVLAGSTVTFYINGTAITAAHTTNIPTGAGRQTGYGMAVHKTLGAGALTMQMDYIKVAGLYNGQRVA